MARKLAAYNAKRDFKKTAEPSGKVSRSANGFRFLVQKHEASHLHYDFRLELDGVLKSWAVTRGPSVDPADKRLAVEVEDHPVAYGDFEGIIPQGEYGGGTVMLWDEGSWEPQLDPHQGLKEGSLKFILHGKRLKGEWALVRMKPRPQDRGRNNWLLIKHRDAHAVPGGGEAFLEKHATSVVSKRPMQKIASDADRQWGNATTPPKAARPLKKTTALTAKPIAAKTAKATTGKAKVKPLPAFIAPQLATLTTEMPQGKEWLHEIKFDGYRVLSHIENGAVRMLTRNGIDWTEKFGDLPEILTGLKVSNAILDGELVAMDKDNVSSFSGLKNALSVDGGGLIYYVFDLLFLNGEDMRARPLIERKQALAALLKKQRLSRVFYSEHFAHEADFMQRACGMGLEGVISKRADAPYHSGRVASWLKTKCHKRQEFVIGGYTPSSTGAKVIGSLLLGYYAGKEFVYAGRVGTGFDQKMARQLFETLQKLTRKTMAYTQYSDGGRRGTGWKRGVYWVEPKLVCEVEFTEWTEDGALRHPSFQGLREDKPARSIVREKEMPTKKAVTAAKKEAALSPAPARRTHPAARAAAATRATKKPMKADDEVTLTNPDKIVYPDVGYTKQDLADYYAQVSDWILPHIIRRPLSMVRCPEGSGKACFFQRHGGKAPSPHLHPLHLYRKEEPYLMIEDAEGLKALVQMGALEIHIWGSHATTWDKPDMIVFDFDPDEGLDFNAVKQAAMTMRARLETLKLKSFLKTTGGKGLHAVVPIRPNHGWDTIKQFAKTMAEAMAADFPKLYTTNMRKAERKGRIFIDYLRNGETATAIAPYSSRARAGATVAVPLAWDELPKLKAANLWNIKTLPKRLQQLKQDPWDDFLTTKQSLKLPV